MAPDRLTRLLLVLRRAARTTSIRLAAYAVLTLGATWLALGQVGGTNDFRDAHLLEPYEQVARSSVLDHGQIPFWDPYHCGGLYALGNPQTRFASPTFLASLIFGERRGEAILLALFLLLGMEGAYRYARVRLSSALGPALAAPIFALSGYYAISWTLGWIQFLGFLLLPWMLWGTAMAARGRIVGVATITAGFAVMIGFGGTYPVPLCALFVAFEGARSLLSRRGRRSWKRAVPTLGAAALSSLAACAFRMWPIIESMAAAPRVMAGRPSHDLLEVARMMFGISPLPGTDGGTVAICFVGYGILLMAVGALFTRRAIVPAVGALVAIWLATGYAYPGASFGALRALPLFDTLRYPYRFLLPGAALLAEVGAIGTNVLLWRARRSLLWRRVAVAVCVGGLASAVIQAVNFELISLRAEVTRPPEQVEQPFAQSRGNRWSRAQIVALNRGSLSCGEAYPVPMSELLRGALPAEEYLDDPSAGTATRAAWSPNRIDVDVNLARETTLLVNQNWHPGWKSNVGKVVSVEGLLGVKLPVGATRVTLSFLPRSGIGGLIVSALAFLSLAIAWRVERRRPRAAPWVALGGAIVSLATGPAIAMTWLEPRQVPVIVNPDGEPILVKEVPPDATPTHVTFSVPAEVVAQKIPTGPDANGIVPMRLYWKVNGPVPRSVGIFVHVIGPDGTRKSGDHELLAGSYFFNTAPRGQLIQDDFGVSVHDGKPGTWKVYLGLWHASGDGSRVPVFEPDGKRGAEDRALLGTFEVPPKPGVQSDAGKP